MRFIKAAFFVGLVAGLGLMWQNRELVIAAYRVDSAAEQVRFEGIDLAYRATPVGVSPFRLPASPDTRKRDAGFPAVVVPSTAAAGTPVAVLGGQTVLEGTVTGPDGPVAEAIVKIERLTSEGTASIDLVSDQSGQWTLEGALGGRFRVRAWLPNELTVPSSKVRFVGYGQKARFDFSLVPADPTPTLDLVESGPGYDGLATEVAVVVSTRYVDDLGLVVARPLSGVTVNLQTTGDVLSWPNTGVTGADGSVRVNVECSLSSGDGTGPGEQTGPGFEQSSSGTLRATTTFADVTFPLPGCLAVPEIEPEVGAETGESESVTGEVEQ